MQSESESECNWDLTSVSENERKKRGTPEETPKNPNTREYLRPYENESKLPVTCGDKKGTLDKEKYKKQQACIFSEGQWFKPSEFERFGGKEKSKKWKTSIFCDRIPLQKFIEDGFLPPFQKHLAQNKQTGSPESTSACDRLRKTKTKEDRLTFQSDDDDVEMTVFEGPTLPVTCGSESGILHKYRFSKGNCGRCIRTKDAWLTPEDFIKQAKPGGIWKKDIVTYGKPLGKLIMERVLKLHAMTCDCEICKDADQNQENDDVCFVCDSEEDLVCCDGCPRAFHSHCHLPALDEDLPETWYCTICVIKNMEDSSQKTQQDVLSSPFSQYTLHCQCLLLHLLHESRTDPCTSAPGYSENICGPMMLGRVKMNLENNDYQTVQEFVKDVENVFHRCTSNRDEDSSRMTSKLKDVFQKEFKTVFKLL